MELYCFSCTGNTRRAADITREICGNSTLFAALFPVHAQGIPRLARRQLEALPPMSGPACVICTYGGVSPGAALSQGAAILTRKGLTVLAAAELPDRHSYDRATGGGGLVLPRRWEQEELERFLRAVLAKAGAGGGAVALPRRLAPGRLFPQRALAALGTHYPGADPARCIECGACAAVCPAGAALEHRGRCIRCAACVEACPVGARALTFRTPVTKWYLARGIAREKAPRFYL